MNKNTNYDLEQRTFEFAKSVRNFVKKLPKRMENLDDIKQVIRSSGSIGANYIEANEALSKKDFIMRIKIARKESKETIYWLRLLESEENDTERQNLTQEATELMKIFGSILQKSK
jgi:four helix bundle protein